MITFKKMPVCSPDSQRLLEELNGTLMKILGHTGTMHVNYDEFETERAAFIVGYADGEPVCCGALRQENTDTAEVKRVYARKNKIGAGACLMEELEKRAKQTGYKRLILECRSGNAHAIEFYKKNGYTVCASYPPYDTESDAVCMDKYLF